MDEIAASPSARCRISPRLVMGLAVMAFGVLLTLHNFDVVNMRGLWQYWPLVFVLIGLGKFLQRGDAFGGLLWVGVGAALIASNLGALNMRQIWPVVLVAFGARLVWGALGRPSGGRPLTKQTLFDDAARIDAFAVMGGVVRGTNSTTFSGGAASAVMGGCEIDLRQAKLAGGEAVFDVFAMWGGIEVKVPEDWAVENRAVAFLGGVEDKTRRPAEPKGRLVVTGLAVMGGVEVKN
jgi:LiaF transmembrane domain